MNIVTKLHFCGWLLLILAVAWFFPEFSRQHLDLNPQSKKLDVVVGFCGTQIVMSALLSWKWPVSWYRKRYKIPADVLRAFILASVMAVPLALLTHSDLLECCVDWAALLTFSVVGMGLTRTAQINPMTKN